MMKRLFSFWTVAAWAALSVLPVPALAQSVSGTVGTDAGGAVAEVLVVARDYADEIGAVTMSAADGSYAMDVPRAGTWTLHAERYGFATAVADVVVQSGSTATHDFALGFGGMGGEADARCPAGPRAIDAATLLRDARQAFVLRADTGAARFQVTSTERLYLEHEADMAAAFAAMRPAADVERADTFWVEGGHAISGGTPAQILTVGFARDMIPGSGRFAEFDYAAPTPDMLLSPEFLATHCFFLRDGGSPTHVGLAFGPDGSGAIEYDVEGTLWLPQQADQTPYIDFRHTKHPHEDELLSNVFRDTEWQGYEAFAPGDRLDGRIDLAFVEDHGWIVSRYEMRWPRIINSSVLDDQGNRPWVVNTINELLVTVIRMQLPNSG